LEQGEGSWSFKNRVPKPDLGNQKKKGSFVVQFAQKWITSLGVIGKGSG
jgi:hypothetical protein